MARGRSGTRLFLWAVALLLGVTAIAAAHGVPQGPARSPVSTAAARPGPRDDRLAVPLTLWSPAVTLRSARSRWFPVLAGLAAFTALGLARSSRRAALPTQTAPPRNPGRVVGPRGPPRA